MRMTAPGRSRRSWAPGVSLYVLRAVSSTTKQSSVNSPASWSPSSTVRPSLSVSPGLVTDRPQRRRRLENGGVAAGTVVRLRARQSQGHLDADRPFQPRDWKGPACFLDEFAPRLDVGVVLDEDVAL